LRCDVSVCAACLGAQKARRSCLGRCLARSCSGEHLVSLSKGANFCLHEKHGFSYDHPKSMSADLIRLVLNPEGGDLLTHELRGDFALIGRAPSNHIVIDHPAVSGQHALLLRVRHSYWLMDLNSTNGTQINGVLVTDAEVKDGDKVRFGGITAVFAGRCCKSRSKRGLRRFWTTISI
jgi:FHA domain